MYSRNCKTLMLNYQTIQVIIINVKCHLIGRDSNLISAKYYGKWLDNSGRCTRD